MSSINRYSRRLCVALIALSAAASAPALPPLLPAVTSAAPQGWCSRAAQMYATGNYLGVEHQLRHYLQTAGSDALYESAAPGSRQRALLMLLEAASAASDKAGFLDAYSLLTTSTPLGSATVTANLLRADFDFFRGNYAEAARGYAAQNLRLLPPAAARRYTFRHALSSLKSGDANAAEPLFLSLTDSKEYGPAAQFYLGYIDYSQSRLDEALQRFARVPASTAAELGVSFYEAQILFAQGNTDQVVKNSTRYLDDARRLASREPAMLPETRRIVGESYYALGNSDRAYPLLTKYLEGVQGDPRPSALYTVGAIDYSEGRRDEAAKNFARVVELDPESSQAQSALLYLGQCSAAQGDYSAAARAFERAAKMTSDPDVAETALYNYAVACSKGGQVPFGSSSALLEKFTERYPKSQYSDSVEQFLATAYFNDHDYARALSRINRISRPDSKTLAIKQQILFELGVEAFSTGKYSEAENYLRQCSDMRSVADRSLAARAQLWRGDALYNQKKYSQAAAAFDSYLAAAPASDADRAIALYDKAYALYQLKQYSAARTCFKEALAAKPSLDSSLSADARLRVADCDYYAGRIADAMTAYAEVARQYPDRADYAAFQHANMQGASGNQKAKIAELHTMTSRWPDSPWIADALAELADAQTIIGDFTAAAATADDMRRRFPGTPQARQAELQIASRMLDAGRTDEAAEAYRNIIRQWPSSSEAATAADDLKAIAARTGDIKGFTDFLNSVPGAPRPNPDELQRLAFEAAEKRLADTPDDIALMQTFVKNYPNSTYTPQAYLYIARVAEEGGRYADAIAAANHVLRLAPDGEAAAPARLLKATALEKSGDKAEAALAWQTLLNSSADNYRADALLGLVRCSEAPADRLACIDQLQRISPADITDAIRLIQAKDLADTGNPAAAMTILSRLAENPKTLEGAEAAVTLGELQLAASKPDKALATLTKFTDRGTPHQYWLARGFIALADAYRAKGDNTTAREYLISLKSNYPGKEKDIASMIDSRLKTL